MLVHLRTEKNGVAELTKQTRTTAGWTAVYHATRDFFSPQLIRWYTDPGGYYVNMYKHVDPFSIFFLF